MTFNLFKHIIKTEVLNFYPGEEWDDEQWNRSYIDFREALDSYFGKDYVAKTPERELVVDWATEFYVDAHPDTHNYWIKTKKYDNV